MEISSGSISRLAMEYNTRGLMKSIKERNVTLYKSLRVSCYYRNRLAGKMLPKQNLRTNQRAEFQKSPFLGIVECVSGAVVLQDSVWVKERSSQAWCEGQVSLKSVG